MGDRATMTKLHAICSLPVDQFSRALLLCCVLSAAESAEMSAMSATHCAVHDNVIVNSISWIDTGYNTIISYICTSTSLRQEAVQSGNIAKVNRHQLVPWLLTVGVLTKSILSIKILITMITLIHYA